MKAQAHSTVQATRDRHPSAWRTKPLAAPRGTRNRLPFIPPDVNEVDLALSPGRSVHLTNLRKPFWPKLGITKGDLLGYYTAISPLLLPHLIDRAMVMKRYPNGAAGDFFFMKRAPSPRPDWISLCSIEHASGNEIAFPVVADLATLLWMVNLGCIDLNPWYARCDDVDRPDYLHFDLDPVPGARFAQVRDAALAVREALTGMDMPCFAKTTGSRGIHIYVPIVRGPTQKQVWSFAKQFALSMELLYPKLLTAVYRVADRPKGRVMIDYNQNAWGRTLASVYSVRPTPAATVSAPVTWKEVEQGIEIGDFHLRNMTDRVAKTGDLWKPLLDRRRRVKLETWL